MIIYLPVSWSVHPIRAPEKELPLEVYDEIHMHSQLPVSWFLTVLDMIFLWRIYWEEVIHNVYPLLLTLFMFLLEEVEEELGLFFIYLISPAGICLFKINNGNSGTIFKICLKLIIKAPGWLNWRLYGVFIVNFKDI